MAYSIYDATAPLCAQQLTAFLGVCDKAAEHCAEKKIDEAWLLTDRLAPDMFSLGRQIRQLTDFARNTVGRLAGVAGPDFAAADPTSFAEAKDRVQKSLDFVNSITRAQLDGTEDKQVSWTAGTREMSFKGDAYVRWFALPNFYFFCTTAYNILRYRGVPVGKGDFLGPR